MSGTEGLCAHEFELDPDPPTGVLVEFWDTGFAAHHERCLKCGNRDTTFQLAAPTSAERPEGDA